MFQKTFALTERSLRVEARSLSGHLLRFLIIGGLLWFIIPAASSLAMIGRADIGLTITYALACINAILISVLGMVYFGNCITEEKEERTLPLLLLADIGPLALLSGKLLPRLVTVSLIVGIQIPFTLLAVTLGGVVLPQILATYLAVTAYLMAVAALGGLFSVIFRTPGNAIGATGLSLLAYHIGPLVCLGAGPLMTASASPLIRFLGNSLSGIGRWLNASNVFVRITETLSIGYANDFFTFQVLSNLGAAAGCFALALAVFPLFNQNLDAEPVRSTKRRTTGRAAGHPHTARRAWGWPVVWKEYVLAAGGHTTAAIKIVAYGALCLFVGAMSSGFHWSAFDFSVATVAAFWVVLAFILIELLLLLARSYSVELKEQTWGTLNMLPTSSERLAYAKLLGVLLSLWPVVLWTLVCFGCSPLPAVIVQGSSYAGWLGTLTFCSQCVLFYHLVVFSSILTKNGYRAIVVAGMLLFLADMTIGSMTTWLTVATITHLKPGADPSDMLEACCIVFMMEALFVVLCLHLGSLLLLARAADE